MNRQPIRNFLLLITNLALSYIAIAQPNGNFKEWGQVSYGDIQISECLFEKNADALLILDLGEMYFQKNNDSDSSNQISITSAYYQRYKVLTDRGVEKAKFSLSYSADKNELLSHVKAACYNYEHGKMIKTELGITDVHYNTIDEDETEVSFTVPGVKKGSVFEIAYERNQLIIGDLPEWYFDSDIPCLQSTLKVSLLDAIEYHIKKQITHKKFDGKSEPFTSDIKMNGDFLKGKTLTYTALNLPSVRFEPFMNSRMNYRSHIAFFAEQLHAPSDFSRKLIVTWSLLNEWYLDEPKFGHRITGAGIPREVIKDLLKNKGLTNAALVEKAKAIFEFVRKNVTWNEKYAVVATPTNAETWRLKSGHSASINLLLLNTLLQEGIKAYPMLVGVRGNGYLYTKFPIYNQFENVVVIIESEQDKKLMLDARYKYLPMGLPAFELLNNYGYVIRSCNDGYWHYLKSDAVDAEVTLIKAALDETGVVKGEINTAYNNYTQADYRYVSAAGRKDLIDNYLKTIIPLATIEKFTDSIDEVNNKFFCKVNFNIKPATDNRDKIYLTIPSIYTRGENPFVSEDRISDIDIGYKRKSSVILQLELPKQYELDSLHPPVALQTADTSLVFTYTVEQVGQTLFMRQKIEYLKSVYPLEDYNSFYDFHQKYYSIMQQPVVLRKKKQ